MKRFRGITALLLTFATAAAAAIAFAQPALAVEVHLIQNIGSGMCIQPPPGHESEIGVQLEQEPCNTGIAAQRWEFIPINFENFRLRNQASFGCMDAHGPNADRTPVDTWPCSLISNQKWHVSPPNFKDIISAVGSRCLDVSEGSLGADALIQIFHCTSPNTAQRWQVI